MSTPLTSAPKYRPLTKNTKTTIYPVFADEGDTIPLSQYCPDAKTITFGVGFDKPSYLSINADNELEIASNAVTETQPVLVRLTGINYIDSVDFQFYLIIVQAANPTVRAVDELTMRANSSFDLFQIVSGADVHHVPKRTHATDRQQYFKWRIHNRHCKRNGVFHSDEYQRFDTLSD